MRIQDSYLSTRTKNILEREGYKDTDELMMVSRNDILCFKNLSKEGYDEIIEILTQNFEGDDVEMSKIKGMTYEERREYGKELTTEHFNTILNGEGNIHNMEMHDFIYDMYGVAVDVDGESKSNGTAWYNTDKEGIRLAVSYDDGMHSIHLEKGDDEISTKDYFFNPKEHMEYAGALDTFMLAVQPLVHTIHSINADRDFLVKGKELTNVPIGKLSSPVIASITLDDAKKDMIEKGADVETVDCLDVDGFINSFQNVVQLDGACDLLGEDFESMLRDLGIVFEGDEE